MSDPFTIQRLANGQYLINDIESEVTFKTSFIDTLRLFVELDPTQLSRTSTFDFDDDFIEACACALKLEWDRYDGYESDLEHRKWSVLAVLNTIVEIYGSVNQFGADTLKKREH